MLPRRCILAVFLMLAPALGFAQGHGAAPGQNAASSEQNAEAAVLHQRFFADPRSYRLPGGGQLVVALARWPGAPTALLSILDVESGRIINVASAAMDTLSGPEGETFVLREHGMQIEWRRQGEAARTAVANQAITSEDVEFTNGNIRLAGRLTRPGPGRRPVVILSHGSEEGERNFAYYALLAGYFAERGFTVFTYDKRGTGRSSGDWRQATIRELGGDLSAAVRFLATRRDVDPRRIGVFGVSQGGFLGPFAAAETGQVAFLALFAAPPVDTWASEMNETNADLAARNFTPEQTAAALRAMRIMFVAAEAGAPTPELEAAVAEARREPWFRVVELSGTAANITALRAKRYDPRPILNRLRTPIFLAYGETDLITPYRQYVPAWRSAMAQAGNRDVTIKVYAGANHGLLVGSGHGPNGSAAMSFAPTVLQAVSGWMEARAGLRPIPQLREPATLFDQADVALRASSLAGTYATANGTVVLGERNGTLIVQDFERGRITVLQPDPVSRTGFVGLGLSPDSPATPTHVHFPRDGRLVLSERGQPDRVAHRVILQEREVSYRSGPLNQNAILVTPAGRGPFPAVVFLGGDGPSTRQNFLGWARLFAANGIAALSIDKRGYGGSDGDGPSATLQDNADDAAAAVAFLASRSDIRRGGIGLVGSSRGGWTAPMAAVQRPGDIAFIIASSGGPVSVRDQERYNRLLSAGRAGATGDSAGQAAQVIDDYFAYLASDGRERATQVSANFERYGHQPWYRAMRLPTVNPTVGTWPPARRVFAEDLRLDARALYDRLNVPILFLYGTADPLFPPEQAIGIARDVASRHPGSEVRVFEGGNHNFDLPARPGDIPVTAPGYYQTMIDWAHRRLSVAGARGRGSAPTSRTRRASGGSGR